MEAWNNCIIVTDNVAIALPTDMCIDVDMMYVPRKPLSIRRLLIIFPDLNFLAGMWGQSLDMAKGEFQKNDTSFSVLSSWVRGPRRWLRLRKGLGMDTQTHFWIPQKTSDCMGVGVKVIMTGEFIPNESQGFRYGCQQKNFGGILTLHLNST